MTPFVNPSCSFVLDYPLLIFGGQLDLYALDAVLGSLFFGKIEMPKQT
jgi:hypothetical protein